MNSITTSLLEEAYQEVKGIANYKYAKDLESVPEQARKLIEYIDGTPRNSIYATLIMQGIHHGKYLITLDKFSDTSVLVDITYKGNPLLAPEKLRSYPLMSLKWLQRNYQNVGHIVKITPAGEAYLKANEIQTGDVIEIFDDNGNEKLWRVK